MKRGERIIAGLLALTTILVAGIATRAAARVDEGDRYVYTALQPDQPARIGEHGTLLLTGVRVGGVWRDRDTLVPTSGIFVVFDFEITAGIEETPSISAELLHGEVRYLPVETEFEPTPPGFSSTRSELFEVPAEVLDDLVLVIGQREFVYSQQHWLRWQVEVPAEISPAAVVALPDSELWVSEP